MKTKTTIITAGAVVAALSAAGVGIAVAEPSPSAPSSSPTDQASPSQKADQKAGKEGQDGKKGKKGKQLERRALHGEATLGGEKKQHVITFQRGVVSKVDGAVITVTSADGFDASYSTDTKTKVHRSADGKKAEASAGDVKVEDRVRIRATKDGSKLTATVIGDQGPKK